MNNDEAKFILRAYRPGGRDAGQAAFAPALEQARRDPALAAWFAQEQAYDAAIAGKLRGVTPPAGLRDAILAGVRVSAVPRAGRRRMAWMALAASAAVLLGSFALWRGVRVEASPMAFAEFALNDMGRSGHGGHGEDAAGLQKWLAATEVKLAGGLPVDFEKLRQGGCRMLSFNGRQMAEVCFVRNGAVFHLYVMPRAKDSGAKVAEPQWLAKAAGSAAVWSDGRNDYALVSAEGMQALRNLI